MFSHSRVEGGEARRSAPRPAEAARHGRGARGRAKRGRACRMRLKTVERKKLRGEMSRAYRSTCRCLGWGY